MYHYSFDNGELFDEMEGAIERAVFEDPSNVKEILEEQYRNLLRKGKEEDTLAIPMEKLDNFKRTHPEYRISKEFNEKHEYFFVETVRREKEIESISFTDILDLHSEVMDAIDELAIVPDYILEIVNKYQRKDGERILEDLEWERRYNCRGTSFEY